MRPCRTDPFKLGQPFLPQETRWPERRAGSARNGGQMPASPRQRNALRKTSRKTASPPAGVLALAVSSISRSLNFYLRLGCEVTCAADGWVQLGLDRTSFVLHLTSDPCIPRVACLVLPTALDPRSLVRLMGLTGVLATAADPTNHYARAALVTDPDGHLVRIARPAPSARTAAPA